MHTHQLLVSNRVSPVLPNVTTVVISKKKKKKKHDGGARYVAEIPFGPIVKISISSAKKQNRVTEVSEIVHTHITYFFLFLSLFSLQYVFPNGFQVTWAPLMILNQDEIKMLIRSQRQCCMNGRGI